MKRNIITNKTKGFTIVELLVVIVVIGILAAISIVSYSGVSKKARDTATKQLVGDLVSAAEIHAQDNDNQYPSSSAHFTAGIAKVNSTNYTNEVISTGVDASANKLTAALAVNKIAIFGCQATASVSALTAMPAAASVTGNVIVYNVTDKDQTEVASSKLEARYIGTATSTNFTNRYCHKL